MEAIASHSQCYSQVSLGQPFPSTIIPRKHATGKKRAPRRCVRLNHAVRIRSQAGFGRGIMKIKEEEEETETAESEPSSGTKKIFNFPLPNELSGTVKLQNKGQSQPKSNKVVFVAGATGKVGSRTVRELLKLGFTVRASSRSVEKARALFEEMELSSSTGSSESDNAGFFSPAKLFGFLKPPKSGKTLEIVECDLEDQESIEPALGNAGVVVCCIGASEKEVLDVSGPYRIDFKATDNLIKAASAADVSHFVLLTSLGTQKFGFPAAVLNLFWGVLVWKAKAEKALIQSGLPYTIVRPGGMERPTDAYKETHNLILAEADKLFGGQVSNLQVAELLASIVENPDASLNKIVEAIAETTAPLRPIRELLEEIPAQDSFTPEPSSIRKAKPAKAGINAQKASKKQQEERLEEQKLAQAQKEKEEKRIQAQKDKEEKRLQAERDEKEKLRLQNLRQKYEEEIEAAKEKEEAARAAAAAALAEKAELEKKAAEIRAKAEAAALAASQAKAVEAAVLVAARKGNILSDEEKEKIMESVRLARLPKEPPPAEPPKPKPRSKKEPAFSFIGRAVPSLTATKETEEETQTVKEAKEEKRKKDQEVKLAEAKKKEEQERLEKERVEKEAAEAKQKEEADAKRKEEELAEAKKKEEELAKAKKKEEEEKAKKEAEKLKAEAEAKKKEEEEKAKEEAEKLKAEAEAKKKEEEEKAKEEAEKLKAEAEAKKKEEEKKSKEEAEKLKAEAKAKEEEEEKAKEEAEKLKTEEEKKAKELAEQEAAKEAVVSASEEKLKEAEASAPRGIGFRWFWQPAEPETPDVEEATDVTVEAKVKEEVTDGAIKSNVTDVLPPCSTPLSPYTRYPGLKPPTPPTASPSAPMAEKVITPKADIVSSKIKSVDQTTAKVELPSQKDPVAPTKELRKEGSEDDIEARKQQIQEAEEREQKALEKAQAAVIFKWPWQKSETTKEDSDSTLKEGESAASPEAASVVSEQAGASSAIPSQGKSDTLPESSRPLSPYAQFPGLKPPSPPKASPAGPQNGSAVNSKPAETLPAPATPLSPYAGFPDLKPPTSPAPFTANGALPVAGPAATTEEKKETEGPAISSGFKWPWQQ